MPDAPAFAQSPRPMKAAIRAGIAYWAIVFGIGFVLGTIRVLWLLPLVGEETAVLLESPFILGACVLAAWWLTRVFGIGSVSKALIMGALAFALLMMAEVALGIVAFDMTPREWLASILVPPGLWGLLGQIGFALFPAGAVLMRKPSERMRRPAP